MKKALIIVLLILLVTSLVSSRNDFDCHENLIRASTRSNEGGLSYVMDHCDGSYIRMARNSLANIHLDNNDPEKTISLLNNRVNFVDGYSYDSTKLLLEAFFNKGDCDSFSNLYANYLRNYRSVDRNKFNIYNSLCINISGTNNFDINNETLNLLVVGNTNLYEQFVSSNEELDFLKDINVEHFMEEVSCKVKNGLCDCSDYDYKGPKLGFDKTLVLTNDNCRSNVILNRRLAFSSTYSENNLVNFNYLTRLLFSDYLYDLRIKDEFASFDAFLNLINEDPIFFYEKLNTDNTFKNLFLDRLHHDLDNNYNSISNLRFNYYFNSTDCQVSLASADVPELNGLEVNSVGELEYYRQEHSDARIVALFTPNKDIVCSSLNNIMRVII